MIAGCPKCSARYRVDADKIGPNGAKLRCTKCSALFLVRAPEAQKESAKAPAEVPAAPKVAPAPVTPPITASSSEESTSETRPPMSDEASFPDVDSARLVIIADPEEARGKATAEAVGAWGLTPYLVLDGVEAMLAIQRMLPSAVVLDAALPKMFGFQVCEVIKRNESLRETVVVLVGAIHHETRYRREPQELYGADVYIEQPDLPDGLLPILREAGLPFDDVSPEGAGEATQGAAAPSPVPEEDISSTPSASSLAPTPTPVTEEGTSPPADVVAKAPEAEAPSTPVTSSAPSPAEIDEDPEKTEERERAQRLARIAVSEMLLYQPEKFEQAARNGTLEQELDLEIGEARALLRQRISEEVRAETDFIIDELNRVAAERNSQE